jgi:topoisomerase-4 subunit A
VIEEAAPTRDIPLEAMIEREPVTVILSKRGWIRAMKGHADLGTVHDQKFKEGDGFAQAFHAQTTDKLLVAADDGRFFTLGADKLPGGRGFGDPIRAMIDIDAGAGIRTMFVASAAPRVLLASTDGRGFIATTADLIAETRKGRNVMNFNAGARLLDVILVADAHDHVVSVGSNRRLLVFPLDQMPTMARGKGVLIQRFRESGLEAVTTIALADGLSWPMGGGSGRVRTETDLTPWVGSRSGTGRTVPNGFPREAPYFPALPEDDE